MFLTPAIKHELDQYIDTKIQAGIERALNGKESFKTVKAAAEYMGVSAVTVYAWIASKKITRKNGIIKVPKSLKKI